MRTSGIILFSNAIAILSLFTNVQSYSRELTHEDVGAYHTLAFEKLGEKFALKKPKNIKDVIRDLGDILVSFCEENDSDCIQHARDSTIAEFRSIKNGPREVAYPEGFHPDLAYNLDKMYDTISLQDGSTIDEIVDTLTYIKGDIEDIEDADEIHKLSALAGLSVAIESTQLWHSVFNDESHSLHFLAEQILDAQVSRESEKSGEGDRQLQSLTIFIDLQVPKADIDAALAWAWEPIPEAPFRVFYLPGLLSTVVPVSVAASAATFFLLLNLNYGNTVQDILEFFLDLPDSHFGP